MDPERWAQVTTVFRRAREAGKDRQARVLARECAGDEELRTLVERLLEHADQAGDFLEGSALDDVWATTRSRTGPLDGPADAEPPADSRFEIVRELGRGGFGVVYEAVDRQTSQRVALKTLRWADAESLLRFKREFRGLVDVVHPNLARLYELRMHDGKPFFTMELVDGVDFLEYVRGAPRPDTETREAKDGPVARVRLALPQLADALDALHAAGKLHRDVKPSNVLVDRSGRLVLLDFGLVTDRAISTASQTLRGAGTPAYVSPEQADDLPLSEATDWYSVGVLLFEALTGRLPFTGTVGEILRAKRNDLPPPARSLDDEIPADLADLCTSLLERDPERRGGSLEVRRYLAAGGERPANAAPAWTKASPFVGRAAERAALEEAYEAMRSGRTAVAVVRGASGIGKTALARFFLDEISHRDPRAVILRGRCYEQESLPFKMLDGMVDELCRLLSRLSLPDVKALLPRDPRPIGHLFPVFRSVAERIPSRAHAPLCADPQDMRQQAFEGLREVLGRLADQYHVVLFLDDVQWGDADSERLLAEILHPPNAPALMVLATRRSDPEPPGGAGLELFARGTGAGSGVMYVDVELRELEPGEALDLARRLLPDARQNDPSRAAAIARESIGHPLMLQELVHMYTSARDLGEPSGRPEAPDFDTLLRARVERLPDAARRVLHVLVLGTQPLPIEAVGRIVGRPGEVRTAVGDLLAARLVRALVLKGGEHVEVLHDRFRESLAGALEPEAARALHLEIAKSLDGGPFADPRALATHYAQGGDREQAAEHALTAADLAFDAYAFDRSAALYESALDMGAFSLDREVGIRSRRAEALAYAGRAFEAARCYLDVARLAPDLRALDFERRAAEQFMRGGHMEEGFETLGALMRRIGLKMPASDARALAELALSRAGLRVRGLRRRESGPAGAAEMDLLRIDACWAGAMGFTVVHPLLGAVFQARHLRLALESGDERRTARALATEAGHSATGGRSAHERTADLIERALELAGRAGDDHTLAYALTVRGVAAFLEGEWTDARCELEKAQAVLRERCRGAFWELQYANFYHLRSLEYLGDLRSLVPLALRLVEEAEDRGNLLAATNLRVRVAYLAHLALDRPDEARTDIDRGLAAWWKRGLDVQHHWALYSQTAVDLYCGNAIDAWRRGATSWKLLRRSPLRGVQVIRVECLFNHARCALGAAASGRLARSELDAAVSGAAGSLARLRAEDAAWAAPLADLVDAGLKAMANDVEGASGCLASARSEFARLHMSLHEAVALRAHGLLVGGETGRSEVERAERSLRDEGLVDVERFARILVPFVTT